MSRPLVSIVTPSYNQARFLEETIESVLGQDYPNVEYIVVDDGSTDESVDIIRRYSDRLAWWTAQPNAGQVAAINRGFERASGDILGWLNADDTLLPGAVSTVVEALERDPEILLAYGDAVFIDEASRRIGYFPAADLDVVEMVRTCMDHIVQPGSLFRRRALEVTGGLNERAYYCLDFEFVVKLALVGEARRIHLPLATYRIHPESKSVSAPVRRGADFARMYDELFARRDLPETIRAVEREGKSRAYLTAAELYFAGRERRVARRYLLRALRLYPRRAGPFTLSLLAKTFLPDRAMTALRRLRAQLRVSARSA